MRPVRGNMELPVKVRIKGREEEEEPEEELPILLAGEADLPVHRMGKGQSDQWKAKRQTEKTLAELQTVLEKERREVISRQEAAGQLRALVDSLTESEPESPLFPLLDAWVMLREGRKEEAGWVLKKYEKTRLLLQKEMPVRAVFCM